MKLRGASEEIEPEQYWRLIVSSLIIYLARRSVATKFGTVVCELRMPRSARERELLIEMLDPT